MVHAVIPNNSIAGIGYVLNASERGKIEPPIEPAAQVYSHFKDASDVPASEGNVGVPISKLNILDILVERLNQMKNDGTMAVSLPIPEDRLDALIEAYKAQIRNAVEAHAVMPYVPAPLAQVGAIFNLLI